ncbi:uncharacterized protein LOC132858904 isoform X1 [Tachysurus vachellii]|uniref:uncharacterized protein LOC132858904 isoform X1 n=1 Tax=Tachysurus vachellii TaxID=175792 RepID=UPI00296AE421|nr:uncharacterized protein LOC132858904 isoform X1 [Tachysurus vachellii]XP_060745433.1 uncharacterized protein LOC132858904 isoform X1 [Tachysurus vachellii]XP_060745434.1 uncharacterized protein LOC132858904 isoform X1 [Tachysurus vachellii]XP_060745436.1 uncharacterized protein LOC132858904 isoform X1 [Tachysurus vachellii]XP_060745437.1 uncharacterized protein LOC132858904 isoform X1 [Tachysurus vachellii]
MAEAEKRYEQEKETNAHLLKEKLDLMSQVENLKGKVEGLGELLAKKLRQCAEALLILNLRVSQFVLVTPSGFLALLPTQGQFLLRSWLAIAAFSCFISPMNSLRSWTSSVLLNFLSILICCPILSLCEAETKYSEVMKTNTKLENENSTLHFTVDRLQDLVNNLKKELSETKRTCNAALRECEQEREAYSIMQSQCDQIKETLSDQEKSHAVSLAKAVEKYNQAAGE